MQEKTITDNFSLKNVVKKEPNKFGEGNRRYDPSRLQYLAKKLLPSGSFEVLDVGSGLGEFSDVMKMQGYEVVCIDGNKQFVQRTREKGVESYVCDFEKEKFPFDKEEFDGVVCLETIEHIWNVENLLKEIKRVLKPNGWLLLSTPNYNFWKFRIEHLFGKLCPASNTTRHKRFYSFNTLVNELKSHGFRIEDYLTISIVPKIGIRFTTRIFPNLLALHIAVKCVKS